MNPFASPVSVAPASVAQSGCAGEGSIFGGAVVVPAFGFGNPFAPSVGFSGPTIGFGNAFAPSVGFSGPTSGFGNAFAPSVGFSGPTSGFGNPSLIPTPPPMSFTQKLQLVLDTASTLPLHVDLGEHSCSWENGMFKWAPEKPSFRKLERDELLQLMRRLHAAPHAVLLNLDHHEFGAAVMQEMAAPMTALSKLQVLVLSSACPPPLYPLAYYMLASGSPPPPPQQSFQPHCNRLKKITLISRLFLAFFVSCDANFVVIMSTTPPPPCTIAAGI